MLLNLIPLLRLPLSLAFLGSVVLGAQSADIIVNVDRTARDWSDLAMGPPSAEDDADQSRNPRAVFSYVPAFGKPHADAGARGFNLPRLNDGKFASSGDDPANSTWFDTKENSRVLVDLGRNTSIARINVYSWHSGALSPQRYTLWASDAESTPSADPADLAKNWREVARVDTFPLGDGGKHGSSINARDGEIGRYRYLLFDLPANKPEWSRSGFLSEIDVYAVGRKLEDVVAVKRTEGSQHLKFGNIHRTKPLKDETPFLVAGPKLYEYGAMDGTFPRVGRLDGDQGGVWCHPIKLVDKFEFNVSDADQKPWRLVGPSRFEHSFASATFHFERNQLKVTRQDFVPEDEPALVSLLTLRNETDKPRHLTVRFSAAVNIRPSYESRLPNGPDALEYRDGLVEALDSKMAGQWGLVFGSDPSPAEHRIEGSTGILTYSVKLPASGEATLRFLIVGEHQNGVTAARARFKSIAGRTAEMLARKEALYRDQILGGVKFSSSDQAMNDAFVCAKANVMMSVMDLRPGYPAPFLAAGFPIYTWLFGCDSLHSTAGVTAAGFDEAARGTLECLLHYAGQKKQGAHEVASNGRLLGWDHIQETPQLVLACWKHFQWTGDLGFLKAAYPVCREIIAHVLATADQDHDGYLEGPGLMEQDGMGPERIDSVCQLYAAYESLAVMAEALGESGANDYRRRATELKRNFNRDWWNPVEKMWACSLRTDGSQTMDNFWAVVFPQQVGLAEPGKAAIALNRIQKEWVNDQWGFVHQWKPKITGEGVGVVHNNVLAQTAFAYARPELGWRLMQLSAKAPLGERMLGAFDETTPGGGDLMQLWSFGPFLECVIEGLGGVRPQPGNDRVDLFPQLPRNLDWFKIEDCRIGKHVLTLEHRKNVNSITTTVTHSQGNAPLSGTFWLPSEMRGNITVNGQVTQPASRKLSISGIELPGLFYDLHVGQRLTIERITP
ncbi:MAG: GH116 family glycosyl hydrolase [Verrucomicrobia bacterium]|nr:GH116 family glycosyl hydrolase [Verrucomicrobiota bacterium]